MLSFLNHSFGLQYLSTYYSAPQGRVIWKIWYSYYTHITLFYWLLPYWFFCFRKSYPIWMNQNTRTLSTACPSMVNHRTSGTSWLSGRSSTTSTPITCAGSYRCPGSSKWFICNRNSESNVQMNFTFCLPTGSLSSKCFICDRNEEPEIH